MMPGPSTPPAPTLTLSGGTRLSKSLRSGQPFVIGSSRAADFRIPHPSIAPRHVVLAWNGSETTAEDASGGRGFSVNGGSGPTATLQDGDILRVGDFEFRFQAPAAGACGTGAPLLSVTFRGRPVPEVPVAAGLTFGSGPDADVRIEDSTLLAVHATLERDADGFVVVDKGGSGLLANGRFFDRHPLLIGDRLDFGDQHAFAFDGFALRRIPREAGCAITAQHLDMASRRRSILADAGFAARAGEFAGIIGPSGAGKSTLLRLLAGIRRPTAGTVRLNETDVSELDEAHSYFGYVPQEEIVHLELTGRQALRYAAALRLPARTPRAEIEKLIANLAARLGLSEHLDTVARELSGGQLKRLSVAVELLSLPPILLLDEPTSGLDPESESQLMRQLRELTATGCTVVCTTHLMENLHLMDTVEVVSAAPKQGEPGTTVFRGRPSAARVHFDVEDFEAIYEKLREKKPSEWREIYRLRTQLDPGAPPLPADAGPPPSRPHLRRRASLPVLLRRQWDLLRSDLKNAALLLGQPVLIGLLLAIAAAGEKDQSATKLFLACIATFWMACGNAAPELVRERAIFERERFAGLKIASYLGAKFAWLWSVSLVQAALLLTVIKLFGGVKGLLAWQWLALAGTSIAATGVGLCISAWARTTLQAVLLVPVVTIPQILFSGYVFEAKHWNDRPVPRIASRFFPGFASQRLVDTSLMWQQRILNYSDMDDAGLVKSYENLCTALPPFAAWLRASQEVKFTVDETAMYSVAPGKPLGPKELRWDPRSPPSFRLGATYAWSQPAQTAAFILLTWAVIGIAAAAALLLVRRE